MYSSTATSMVIASAVALLCHFSYGDTAAGQTDGQHRSAAQAAPVVSPWNRMAGVSEVEHRIDPLIFFDELVARYRGLTAYSDLTHIVQVTRNLDDTESQRTETRITCELLEGKLNVLTPAGHLRRSLGLTLPISETSDLDALRSRYELWLVPHMALKFAEKPLEELREGVQEGFTATEVAAVTIDDRPMLHLELTSGDGLSGDFNARLDLYVDPESMLIERIEGRQRLPDGGDFETTYHITPTKSEGGEPARCTTMTSQPQPILPQQPGGPQSEPVTPADSQQPACEKSASPPCTRSTSQCTGSLG